jgi:predicted ATPase/class 3 adenylate cyclase
VSATEPSGTITFLFTDIEGSTRLWEDDPEATGNAVRRHDELMREAFEAHHGYVFTAAGDSFAAAFQSAGDAVAAAVEAQDRLAREPWPGPEVRVRMGLHTGEAEERDGDYFGPTVNRSARIMATAHGGQVVMSALTAELARGSLEADQEVVDLGFHHLRDVAEPVPVWELRAGGRPHQFPALRSLGPRGNLPAAPDRFIGRDVQLAEVVDCVSRNRLATVTGPGGVGKTRLAIAAAHRMAPMVKDGTWLCELGSVTDPDAVGHAVGTSLALDGLADTSALIEALTGKQLLLVLDDCEHLIDAVSRLVARIVTSCPEVRVLATSRERLQVEGEVTYPVPLLPADGPESAAVALFLSRAADVRHDFRADPDELEVIAEICRRLDGLPLAIELAAARSRTMSPGDIAGHLDQRFRLLTAGRRSAAERHRTLRGAVDWSYDMLEPGSQELFQSLAVFAGGFTVDAVKGVCGGPAVDEMDVLDDLEELVDKSMVTAPDAGRYTMLATLRQYGRERLAGAGRDEQTARRHAEHFAALVAEASVALWGVDEGRGVAAVGAEFDNVRAAYEWSAGAGEVDLALQLVVSTHDFAYARKRYENAAWAEAVVALPGAEDHPLSAAALGIVAWRELAAGRFDDTSALCERALEVERALGAPPAWQPRRNRFVAAFFNGRVDDARRFADEWCRVTADGERSALAVDARASRVLVQLAMADPDVVTDAEAVLAEARSIGNPSVLCQALFSLATVLGESEPEAALALLDESVSLARAVDNNHLPAIALVQQASLRARHGDPMDALHPFQMAIDHWYQLGNWSNLWFTLGYLGELMIRLDRPRTAAVIQSALTTQGEQLLLQADVIEETLSGLRAQLGADYRSAVEEGANLSVPQLVSYASQAIAALEAESIEAEAEAQATV